MQQGDTAYKNVGGVRYQCVLFPLDYMNCTQLNGSGTYSHCCGTMTDWAGPSGRYPYYAPCDCHRLSLTGSDNIATYVSDQKVLTPSGVSWFAFLFMHDNSVPTQTSFSQGELIGHTGTAGNVTGDHVHLDQCLKNNIGLEQSGQACAGTSDCWYVPQGVQPTAAYFVTGTETVVNLRGQVFTRVEDYTPGPVPPDPPETEGSKALAWFILGLGAGRKYGFKNGRRM